MIAFERLQILPLTLDGISCVANKSASEYDDWILVDPSHRWYKRPQLNYLMSVLLLYITIARRLYSHYLLSAHWARDSRTTESRTMQRVGRGISWAVSLLMIFASQSKSHLYTEKWGYRSSWSVTNWSVARQVPESRSYNCEKMVCISCIIRATILLCDYPVIYLLGFYVAALFCQKKHFGVRQRSQGWRHFLVLILKWALTGSASRGHLHALHDVNHALGS